MNSDVTYFSLAMVVCIDQLKNVYKIKSATCRKNIIRNCLLACQISEEGGKLPFDGEASTIVNSIRSTKVISSLDTRTETFVYDTLLAIL